MFVSTACFALGYLVAFVGSAAMDPDNFVSTASVSPVPALLHAVPYLLGCIKWRHAPPWNTALIAGFALALATWVLTALVMTSDAFKMGTVLVWAGAIFASFLAPDVLRRKLPAQAKT